MLIIKKYVDEMLDKDYIKSNIFLYIASILIIKKFDNEFRICIDYRVFNILTIKNRNILSFIRKTFFKLYIIKIYNKFDIIVVFNEIKMKKDDKKKLRF